MEEDNRKGSTSPGTKEDNFLIRLITAIFAKHSSFDEFLLCSSLIICSTLIIVNHSDNEKVLNVAGGMVTAAVALYRGSSH